MFLHGGANNSFMLREAKWSKRKFLMPHALCRHENCFKVVDDKKNRFQGQAQLNVNSDCIYFKKKWWVS